MAGGINLTTWTALFLCLFPVSFLSQSSFLLVAEVEKGRLTILFCLTSQGLQGGQRSKCKGSVRLLLKGPLCTGQDGERGSAYVTEAVPSHCFSTRTPWIKGLYAPLKLPIHGGSVWTLPARKRRSPNSRQLGHWEERYSGGIWLSMRDILLWGGLAGQEFEGHRSNGTSARGVAGHTEPLSCTQIWQRYSLLSVTGHKTWPDEVKSHSDGHLPFPA